MQTMTWQLQNAKNRFSELVEKASKGEPQLVTKNNKPVVYVIDAETYEKKIKSNVISKKNILLNSPRKEILIEIKRDRNPGRDVKL